MVETKPFKTKLCVLYERGRCGRETCTFAHGDSELRRYQGSFTDRRIYRENDLRTKLERKRSPLRRCSPGRDVKGSLPYKRFSSSQPSKRRKLRMHERVDVQIDSSGNFKSPDGTADRSKDKRHSSSSCGKMLEDELLLKQVQYEVDVLLNQKCHLEIELEETIREANNISSRIRDLEAQLSDENDKSKRVVLKIKKFVKAYVHHSRLQDEIKRSQIRLDQLVAELDMDDVLSGGGEDKLNVNVISDEEVLELKDSASPVRKQLRSSMKDSQGSKSANTTGGHVAKVGGSLKNSLLRFDNSGEAEMGNKRKDSTRPSSESKRRWQNKTSKSVDPLDTLKALESNLVVPPTSMAAHAVDDFIELVEAEENPGEAGTPKNMANGLPILLPPLPTMSQNNYLQYEGDEENVDVGGHEELEEVDIV